jgi:glutathione S-transferase
MNTIEMDVHIKAAPETVWQMLTDGSQLERWFPSRVENSVDIDGTYSYWFDKGDDPKDCRQVTGRYTHLEPFTRFVHTWEYNGEGRTVRDVVEWTLAEEDGGTTVHLRHYGFGSGENGRIDIEEHTQGWTFFLENLRLVIDELRDQRSESGMKVAEKV